MAYDYANIHRFTKSQIGGLTKKLASLRFDGDFYSSTYRRDLESRVETKAKEFGLEYLWHEAECDGYIYLFKTPRKITREQTKFGKAWLKSKLFKLSGGRRNTRLCNDLQDLYFEIAKSVSRFEFIGVVGLLNSLGEPVKFIPIYRTFNRNGKYFDYAPVHWGEPIFLGQLIGGA
jgi:hypothetical protein